MSYIALSTSTNAVATSSGFTSTLVISASGLTVNRSISITADDANYVLSFSGGGLSFSGNGAFTTLSATGAITVTGGTNVAGSITYLATAGLTVQAKTGSNFDFYLANPAGTTSIFAVPTGTVNSIFGGIVSAPGASGFQSSTFVSNARNPIWQFGNALGYGFSYFQGTSGTAGADSIGFHFGTATSAASSVNISSTGLAVTGALSATNTFTSTVPATGTYQVLNAANSSATGAVYLSLQNAGSAFYFGKENSTGSSFGASAYDSIIASANTQPISVLLNGTTIARFSSTGLAVTGSVSATAPIVVPSYTVAGLPSAATYTYAFAFVTDATLTAITGLGLAPIGGGANKVPVYSDGTGWKII